MNKKRFFILTTALVIFLLLFYLVDWEKELPPVPDGMDQQAVLQAGQQAAELLLAQEYDRVYALLRADVQQAMTAEDLSAFIAPTLEQAGEIGQLLGSGASGQTKPEPHAMATLTYDGTDRDLQLGFAFDPEMQLIGIQTELKSTGFRFSNYGKNLTNIGNSIANLFHK